MPAFSINSEELELLQRQLHEFASNRDFVAITVEHDVADLEDELGACASRAATARSPQHGAHAGDQFPDPIGLADIVVGTDLESDDGVDLFVAGRHHDHRCVIRCPDLAHTSIPDIRGSITSSSTMSG